MLRFTSVWTALRPGARFSSRLFLPHGGPRRAERAQETATPLGRLLALAVTAVVPVVLAGAQASERVLYVSAVDKATRAPVETLGVQDLRVTEDGVVREVSRVVPATSSMPVAIVVDNQAAAQPTIADLRAALSSFIRSIDGLGPIALVSTADRPTILQDYTTDQARLLEAANRVFAQPDSGATLLDAIVEVSRGLGKRESDRAAIVLVSLEQIEFSNLYYTQVLDSLSSSGAMLSAVVLLNPAGSMSSEAARNRSVVLDRGILESGGWREDVLASMSYEQALAKIAGALRHQHRVTYSRPETLIPPRKIEVTSTREDIVVRAAPARGQKER